MIGLLWKMLWISGRFSTVRCLSTFHPRSQDPQTFSLESRLEDKVNVYHGKVRIRPKLPESWPLQAGSSPEFVRPPAGGYPIFLPYLSFIYRYLSGSLSHKHLFHPFHPSYPFQLVGLSHSAGLRSVSKDSLTSQAE